MTSTLIASPAHPVTHFARRPRRQQTDAADRWLWVSRCRGWRVSLSRCRFGPRTGPQAIHDIWRVERFDPPNQCCPWGCWTILSQHRKKSAAFAAAEKLLRTGGSPQTAKGQ